MSDLGGWSADLEHVEVDRVFAVLATEVAHGSTSKAVAEVTAELGLRVDVGERAAESFIAAGLVDREQLTLDGYTNQLFLLTSKGRALATRFRRMSDVRQSKRDRNRAARMAMLDWLYSVDTPSKISDMLEDPRAWFYGQPFSEPEIASAADYLMDSSLITGTKIWGAEVLRPSLTTEGHRVVEQSDADPEIQSQRAVSQSIGSLTVYGNAAIQSSDVQQNAEQTIRIRHQAAGDVAGALRLLVAFGELPSGLRREAVDLSEEFQTASQADDDGTQAVEQVGKLRALAGRLGEAGASAAASQFGTSLAQWAALGMGVGAG